MSDETSLGNAFVSWFHRSTATMLPTEYLVLQQCLQLIYVCPTCASNCSASNNWETLEWCGHDLTLIDDQQLSAADLYHMFGYDELDSPFWGIGEEAAHVDNSKEILFSCIVTKKC